MTNDELPVYNLKAVVQQTGIKPDTLRAWERRYSLPEPNRSSGGHRLYSQHDINTLKWLLARQEEGLSISRAVTLWRNLKSEGRDPLQVTPIGHAQEASLAYPTIDADNTIVELRRAWIEACAAFDERKAELVLNQAFSYHAPEIVCFELLQKALAEIGSGWYEGVISVQQEHFASALAVRRLGSLLSALPAATLSGRVIVGCAPGDTHTFSPLLVTYLLRRRRWGVIYLGADVPITHLQATIETTQPNLVVFSAQLLDTAATLLDVAHYVRDIGVPLAYGGYIFNAVPDLTRRIPGHFLGEVLNKVPFVIEQLIQSPRPLPAHEPVSEAYQEAWANFREHSGIIEMQVWQNFGATNNGDTGQPDITHYLTRNILSALKLGDLDYIGSNLIWIEGMLHNHNISPDVLCRFLKTYHQAARQHLEHSPAEIVVHWLANVIEACEKTVGRDVAGRQ
ncbi:MAG: MerR family transcriptional regulator [Candidatus Promineofilum sp.]|nr:MerR family transcriptional regulator [Promineifilum sp.]